MPGPGTLPPQQGLRRNGCHVPLHPHLGRGEGCLAAPSTAPVVCLKASPPPSLQHPTAVALDVLSRGHWWGWRGTGVLGHLPGFGLGRGVPMEGWKGAGLVKGLSVSRPCAGKLYWHYRSLRGKLLKVAKRSGSQGAVSNGAMLMEGSRDAGQGRPKVVGTGKEPVRF